MDLWIESPPLNLMGQLIAASAIIVASSVGRSAVVFLSLLERVDWLTRGGDIQLAAVVLYRLTFHPLAKYPGPFVGRVTDWYSVYHCLKGDRHLDFYRLHARYGS